MPTIQSSGGYLSVVLPAFNEERDIGRCVLRLASVLQENYGEDFHLIVVSDGSDDDTVGCALNAGAMNTTVVSLDQRQGKGSALRHGFAMSTSRLTAQFDADLDIAPTVVVDLVKRLESTDSDIAIASKLHQDSSIIYPRSRHYMSAVYRHLVRGLLKLGVSDTQTGAKVYKTEVIHSMLPQLQETGFAIDLEILALASRDGYSVVEGPVDLNFQFRSSVTARDVFRVFGATLRIWRRVRRDQGLIRSEEAS